MAIVLLHWFNAFVWLIELATGSAIVVSPSFAFMPRWYLVTMESIFGSRANLLRVHMAVGLTWIVVFCVYAIFGWRDYLHTEVLKKEIGLDADDFRWLRIRTLRLVGLSFEPLPPQGAYNAGQKLYAVMVYAMVPLIMITGVDHDVSPVRRRDGAMVDGAALPRRRHGRFRPDDPCLHGRGVSRGASGVLFDDHRHGQRALCISSSLQMVARS